MCLSVSVTNLFILSSLYISFSIFDLVRRSYNIDPLRWPLLGTGPARYSERRRSTLPGHHGDDVPLHLRCFHNIPQRGADSAARDSQRPLFAAAILSIENDILGK